MSVAIVVTVRNERDLLRSNLTYHLALGAERIFVYLDSTTDKCEDTVKDLAGVDVRPSVDPSAFAHRAECAEMVARYHELVTARQCLNVLDAMERARAQDLEWLFAIDADEFICPELDQLLSIPQFLSRLSPAVECVRLPVLEVVQSEVDIFWHQTWFKARPECIARTVHDPLQNELFEWKGFYGHSLGKCGIRLGANACPWNTHSFQFLGEGELQTVEAGHLLHFFAYNARSFQIKFQNFRQHPNHLLQHRPTDRLKRLFRDLVQSFPPEEVELYYTRWVRWQAEDVSEPSCVEVKAVHDFFAGEGLFIDNTTAFEEKLCSVQEPFSGPQFLLIGSAQEGVYQALLRHPLVVLGRSRQIDFFTRNSDRGLEWYRTFFPVREPLAMPGVKVKISPSIGESNLSYLRAREAPKLAHALFPKLRVVVIGQSFEVESYPLWTEHFPPEQVLIIEDQSWSKEPGRTLERVLKFLELPSWLPLG